MITSLYGYLESPYLIFAYSTENAISSIYTQLTFKIDSFKNNNSQIDRKILFSYSILSQINRQIIGNSVLNNLQIKQKINKNKPNNSQINRSILNSSNSFFSQLNFEISFNTKLFHSEINRGSIAHYQCGGYLGEENKYLLKPYLVGEFCTHLWSQINRKKVKKSATQILVTPYNISNLRILYQFPSRGITGLNWTLSSGIQLPGDFSINNLNTDLVEQVFRTSSKNIEIICDTEIPQGIFNDTCAILNHNFTKSATVIMVASNDVTFATIGFQELLLVEDENIFWISKFLPLQSYRYWKFIIQDMSNPEPYLQMGTIIFGSSIIFHGECFVDEVTKKKTHFSDKIKTEGYSSVSNDRALKHGVSLQFRRLNFNFNNYKNLSAVIDYVRTSLKALWIPTPEYSSRFAVFAKLSEIPQEKHKAISKTADYIDLDINLDEAL